MLFLIKNDFCSKLNLTLWVINNRRKIMKKYQAFDTFWSKAA